MILKVIIHSFIKDVDQYAPDTPVSPASHKDATH